MDDIEWQTEDDRKLIAEAQSEYMRGYKYGHQGKFPMPAEMPDEWMEGYEDGRADWLGTIQRLDNFTD